jgi:anaerobic selenocysteine-containing dehydrogenase
MGIPEHQGLASDELVLTSFKVANQTHSRTQNCKYLTEIAHDNPAWNTPTTAADLIINDGDEIVLTPVGGLLNDSTVNPADSMTTTAPDLTVIARVTEAIHPKAIAISHHQGHWAYGRYATAGVVTHPLATTDADQIAQVAADVDANLIWWDTVGYRGNWIIPNAGDPISGAHRVFDTVVTVALKT